MLGFSYGSWPNDSSDSGSEQKKSNMLVERYVPSDVQDAAAEANLAEETEDA